MSDNAKKLGAVSADALIGDASWCSGNMTADMVIPLLVAILNRGHPL